MPYRLSSKPVIGLFTAISALAAPRAATAFSPFLVVPEPAVAEATPAYRYANMTNDEAFAELDRRKVIYSKLDPVAGVRAPIRLTGRLHGVYIHSSLPPDQRVTSPFEILDARLALALDDFAAVLEQHDIDELVHYTMYRPNVAAGAPDRHGVNDDPAAPTKPPPAKPPTRALPIKPLSPAKPLPLAKSQGTKGAKAPSGIKQKAGDPAKPDPGMITGPAGKKPIAKINKAPPAAPVQGKRPPSTIARRDAPGSALHRTTWAPPGTRHPAGLAIDVGMLHKRDGRWLNVARQFKGRIGSKTCGDGAVVADDADAKELRALVCEPAELGIFTYVLTPNYNAAHADHYHMEIKPGVRWFLHH